MFIIFLKFGENKGQAGQYMEGHKAWLSQGFADGVFLMTGSIQPKMGGALLAHNVTLEEIEKRVNEDPFVVEKVVAPEIIEVTPPRADEKLAFLLE